MGNFLTCICTFIKGQFATLHPTLLGVMLLKILVLCTLDFVLVSGEDVLDESNMTFFHGKFKVHIIAAEDLPDTDNFMWGIDRDDKTDAYVTGDLGSARLFKTRYISNDLNPVWDETFDIYVCHHASSFELRVKDKEHVGAVFVASTQIQASDLETGEPIEGWLNVHL